MNKQFFLFALTTLSLNAELDKNLLKRYLPQNPVIVEGGAHVGMTTGKLAQWLPKGTIYAFEPVPKLFVQLKERMFGYSNVTCLPYALSSQTCKAKLYISGPVYDQSSSLLEPKEHITVYPQVKFNDHIEVEAINFDEWAQQNNVDHIDLLALSIQGCEFDVLKSAPTIIKKTKCIYLNIAYCQLYKGSHLFGEVRSWLESQGFKMVSIDSFSRVEGTALFVNVNL